MTLHPIDAGSLKLSDHIRPGDLVIWGQAMAEPLELVSAYLAQRHEIGPTRAFVGLSLSGILQPDHADMISLMSYGALGTLRPLVGKGHAQIIPCRYSSIPALMRAGTLKPDVVFVQLSPPGPDGTHSLGWSNDFLPAAMASARVVLAEINPAVPWVKMDTPLDEGLISHAIYSERPLPRLPASDPGEVEHRIAAHLAEYISDGATLQYGIGAIPAAILSALKSHKDLGLHSGLVTEEIVDLAECGALTNTQKAVYPGVSVGAIAIGGQRLADYVADEKNYLSCQTDITHGGATLSRLDNLVAINSALEVDLSGQVNAEQVGGRYLGAIGGQPDFMHAATHAPDGLSVIALPSTSGKDGERSRLVPRLNGPYVTTPRSDVDLVVTEHGVADLRGLDEAARTTAMIAIAAPTHREALERTRSAE